MFLDARSLEAGTTLEADICVVGAGPAGITLALELRDTGARVLVLESGGMDPEPAAQARAWEERSGSPYPPLERARVRAFGGSSRHWPAREAMMARPLDSIDFERREGLPHSGWPFDREHLEPHYKRAHQLCLMRSDAYALDSWAGTGVTTRLALAPEVVTTTVIQSSPPDAFVRTQNVLRQASDVTVVLHATVVEIGTAQSPGEVSHLRVAITPGRELSVRALRYVLAAGGIDNPRMMLIGNERHPGGIGNQHDLVGRYFMEHLWIQTGTLIPADRSLLTGATVYQLSRNGEDRWRAMLGLTEATVRREGLLNGVFFLDAADRFLASPAAHSLAALRRVARHRPLQPNLAAHAWTVARNPRDIAAWATSRVRPTHVPAPAAFVLKSMSEQAPNPASRVKVGRGRDHFGLPRAHLEWRRTSQDLESIRRAQDLIAREVATAGAGTLISTLDDPAPVVYGTWHHMGTTRMHDDPRQGVTDADGRVHGMRNLWVTGSSVFPTVGYANPTLTIVALAARLADHLKVQLARP